MEILNAIYNFSYLIASILIIAYAIFYATKKENIQIRFALAFTMAIIAISWISLDILVTRPVQPVQRNIVYIVVWISYIVIEFLDSKKNNRS